MNIKEVRTVAPLGDGIEEKISVLEKLYDLSGDCVMNGYLGESVDGISVDDMGNLEFISNHYAGDMLTVSKGAVVDNNVVIKQIQKNDKVNYNQIFTWDLDKGVYTYLLFDNEDSMDFTYSRIKALRTNLCEGDVTSNLRFVGIDFDNITQVLVNQEINPVYTMLNEEDTSFDDSFKMY